MTKKIICALVAALLVLCIAACTAQETAPLEQEKQSETPTSGETPSEPEEPEPITVLGEFVKLEGDAGNWLGLSADQKREDLDYLMQTLRDNYPFYETLKRMHGYDLETEYENLRARIGDGTTDAQFFVMLNQFASSAQSVGHLHLISPMEYPYYAQTYRNLIKGEDAPDARIEKLADAFANEKSAESYDAMGEVFFPVFDRVMEYYDALEEQEEESAEKPEEDADQEEQGEWSNVVTKMIEPGRIAYIEVKGFNMDSYEQDKQVLFGFYEQVKDYDHIIFDFTQNGGGGMPYFDDLIVAPNIDAPLSTSVYYLAKDGGNNKAFLDFTDWKPVSELPDLPRLNADDLAELDLFLPEEYRVEPLGTQKMLDGMLWILVSERVFSSSEYAAMFAKSTGFATLVGTRTGGDGIGMDPLPIILPNSGLMFRYSSIYGVTPDGASSQEYGTEPDVVSWEGQTALDACLKAIAEQN